MRRSRGGAAFYVETLLLVLFLLASLTVLVQILGAAKRTSREARELSTAVNIAQNAAELFAASGSQEDFAALLGAEKTARGTLRAAYDVQGGGTEDETQGAYVLEAVLDETPRQAGDMRTAHFVVTAADGDTVLYELDTQKYIGGYRRGQGGDEMESRPVRLGWLSLLLTVIILCLATLSVLSFSTARADLALAQKQARQAQSVYALECAGQQWLAELDAALAQAGDTAELDALLPHGTAREGPGVSAVLEGADGRSLSVFAELTADGGYRVIQWQQSAEWAGEAEAPALFGTLREG